MPILASQFINWSALGKIVLAALIGGAGVVVVFGFLLLFLKHANAAKSDGGRIANYALGGLCGLICVGAVAVGIYAMAEKPASKAKKAHKASPKTAALVAPSASPKNLIASAP